MTGIWRTTLAEGSRAALAALDDPSIEALEIATPPLDRQPFRALVEALLRAPGFKLELNGQRPAAVLAMVSDRILGTGAFPGERAALAEAIDAAESFAAGLVPGALPQVALRSYFAPGDLVWHVDRVAERRSFRLLWPLGRPAGMRVTPADNIDPDLYRAYMRREHPLLCRLDSQVLRSGGAVETLWAHRPGQLEAMASGHFPFLRDPARESEITPGAISVHRVETPLRAGTWHRSSWANRHAPGVQIVVTVTGDAE